MKARKIVTVLFSFLLILGMTFSCVSCASYTDESQSENVNTNTQDENVSELGKAVTITNIFNGKNIDDGLSLSLSGSIDYTQSVCDEATKQVLEGMSIDPAQNSLNINGLIKYKKFENADHRLDCVINGTSNTNSQNMTFTAIGRQLVLKDSIRIGQETTSETITSTEDAANATYKNVDNILSSILASGEMFTSLIQNEGYLFYDNGNGYYSEINVLQIAEKYITSICNTLNSIDETTTVKQLYNNSKLQEFAKANLTNVTIQQVLDFCENIFTPEQMIAIKEAIPFYLDYETNICEVLDFVFGNSSCTVIEWISAFMAKTYTVADIKAVSNSLQTYFDKYFKPNNVILKLICDTNGVLTGFNVSGDIKIVLDIVYGNTIRYEAEAEINLNGVLSYSATNFKSEV